MNKLLTAEFSRLNHSLCFRLCTLFSVGLGVFLVGMRKLNIMLNTAAYRKLGNQFSIDDLLFPGSLYLVFALASFIGIFLGTEYSDGELRNKVIIGHKRREIYLSKWIVCMYSCLFFYLLYFSASLILGTILLDGTSLDSTELIYRILICLCASLSFCSILVAVALAVPSKSAGSVSCLLLTIFLFYASLFVIGKLSDPEYYGDLMHKLYTVLDYTLPICIQYRNAVAKTTESICEILNIRALLLSSVILTLFTTGTGILILEKKELK